MIPIIQVNGMSRPVFEGEIVLNITSGNISLSPADVVMMKATILKEISFVAWVCLIIGFSFGVIAMYYYCKRKYEF